MTLDQILTKILNLYAEIEPIQKEINELVDQAETLITEEQRKERNGVWASIESYKEW